MGSRDAERVRSLISSYGLPTEIPSGIDRERIISSMRLDKKALAGEMRFILPERIGSVTLKGVDVNRITEAIK